MLVHKTFLLITIASALSSGFAKSEKDQFFLANDSQIFTGEILEGNEELAIVSVEPEIRTGGGDQLVCRFHIIHRHGEEKFPFEIFIEDQNRGTATLKATRELDFENQNEYAFQVEAISCSGTYSKRVHVQVHVKDKNEFSPVWKSDSLKLTLKDGTHSDKVTVIQAEDEDGSDEFGKICKYEIQTENQPFALSDQGILRTTRPLNYTDSHSFVLSILATDCGGKNSTPLLVIIEVKPTCHPGWTDVSSSINYVPSTGPLPLFPDAKFNLCKDDKEVTENLKCDISNLETTVHLETRHIGKGCDRDTYSLSSQRRLCGASQQAISLLVDSVTEGAIKDDGTLSDQTVTLFDGRTGLDLTGKIPHLESDTFPAEKFTLATWMKHEENFDRHRKEHILCKADDHKKNRHHVSLFVRNCKLVLLFRQESGETGAEKEEGERKTPQPQPPSAGGKETKVFKPAEWRWKIPQVCDNEWHHYALNVNFPEVELIVDGEKWIEQKDNPEIIDDWPLHNVPKMNTKLTVGACWQGSEQDYRHHLTGYLAGLWYLPGSTENEEVLSCLHQCAESLQIPAASALLPKMEMVADQQGSKVVVDGPDEVGHTNLIQQVAYLNTREFPSPGKRMLTLSTKAICKGEAEKEIFFPDQKAIVNVVAVQEPTIEISGTSEFAREYEDFRLGVRILSDVHIVMTTGTPNAGEPVNGIENRLDECVVTVNPHLNNDHEKIEVPLDLLKTLGIKGKVSDQGAVFTGAEMIYNYERLLRQVTYTNQKPAYYLNRQFKVVCSEMSRRFVSNEYSQTLNVVHPKNEGVKQDQGKEVSSNEKKEKKEKKIKQHEQIYQPKNAHFSLHGQMVDEIGYKHNDYLLGQNTVHNNVVAVIAVLCVGFLAAFLILGIVRIRATQSNGEEEGEREEMDWDDTALTITVNPLEGDAEKGLESSVPCAKSIEEEEEGCTDQDDEEEEEEDDEDNDDYDEYDGCARPLNMRNSSNVVLKGQMGTESSLQWDDHDV